MVRMNCGPLAAMCATCAFITLVAAASGASCQTLPQTLVARQLVSTRSPAVVNDIQRGNDYLTGNGVGKDAREAVYWYEKAADAGDPWAQQQMGFLCEAGIGVPADPARAVHWYQLAAANGLISAKTNLGVTYLWGDGVRKDVRMAAELFRDAAEKGDGTAATYLGDLYYFGSGVPQDQDAAEHWYKIGARLHEPLAEFDLGTLASFTDDPHRQAKAAEWFRKSMHDGYVPAVHSLALLLEKHPELAKSDQESLDLLQKGSSLGQWKSSEELGLLYTDGKRIPRSASTAYYYLRLATLQGGDQAPQQNPQLLAKLSAELGSELAKKQDAAAQTWYQQHHDSVERVLKNRAGVSRSFAVAAPAGGLHAGQIIEAPSAFLSGPGARPPARGARVD